ncbi:MAG: hypothetical protein QM741_16505 [Rudaea sp.]|uniref:hypothetical protein n=1 Tax=Rudaea sp. TaxID=2136325 RepID=UPI0039E34BE1
MKIVVACLLVLVSTAASPAGAETAAPSVDFIVSASNPAIFYASRPLHKGDRFEIDAHNLSGFQSLVVVPCHPDCENPSYTFAYPLSTGIQHLRIPSSGQYYFWLQGKSRDEYRSFRGKAVQTLLPIARSSVAPDRFSATYTSGTQLSLRALLTHPVDGPQKTMPDPGMAANPDSMPLHHRR